ncbi:thiamine biosynthesis lipoprotein [Microbacterium sp. cf046]|uniref:FAD:protein FMN transferase n=1 Tax=Microbacterium sp. cf046 TaxID=1761803 RepID=UPI0008EE2429|nr:FAD:protein FMN transferase [Microbacterium sp. cf046]SFS03644.1 thiamine biosynthesis lipoprotein [Microbacterium sp. cf046]
MAGVVEAPRPPKRVVRVEEIMGMPISIHVLNGAGELDPESERAVAACFAELREIDQVFSTYLGDSDISRIARGELDLGDADPRVAEVEAACRAAEIETRGLFSAWWAGWFDPTGFVKGWSVENAAHRHLGPLVAPANGIMAVGINAGGDMQLFSAPDSDWQWNVGIADPRRPGEVIATVQVVDGAVATSGSAERGSHIIDPRTGAPARGVQSASVVHDSLAQADLWATTAVVAGFENRSWIAQTGTRTGIVIAEDGRVTRWLDGTPIDVVRTPSSVG